ncbi:MAG: thiamine pyrophosphate-binding protein [Suipraeoptans sp.]
MKISDYIVTFLIHKKITDVFGYPGGMVTHLMDSFAKNADRITSHVSYHEQGAAFAACGYAQITGKPGVAYATSGPGATNLITGIANAYFDSIPTIFITGQVNTYESKGLLPLRQKGFQEMDVVSLVSSITKYSLQITRPEEIRFCLEACFYWALEGRPGPVLLDIPMDIFRADVNIDQLRGFPVPTKLRGQPTEQAVELINSKLCMAKRPCVLVGAGIHACNMEQDLSYWVQKLNIPVVTSMPGMDILPGYPHNFGFIGAYGSRQANFIIAKSDCILSLGSRLDLRQTGVDKGQFAPNATLIRVDIDECELSHSIKYDEIQLQIDLRTILPALCTACRKYPSWSQWISVCETISEKLKYYDDQLPNQVVQTLSELIQASCIVTTDVGQNQIWVAQSFKTRGPRILFSSGHGAMGYSLPAAIGACLGGQRKTVAFTGDGGMQMNIQELQFIVRDQLPIKIVVLNNRSLGMIRHFQEMYFEQKYTQTIQSEGYIPPNFSDIAKAYGIPTISLTTSEDILLAKKLLDDNGPSLIQIHMPEVTYVTPKLVVGKENQDQDPPLPRDLYKFISDL